MSLRSNSLRSTERKLLIFNLHAYIHDKQTIQQYMVGCSCNPHCFLIYFLFPYTNILHTLVFTTILNYSIFLSVLLHRPKYTYLSHYSFSIDHEFCVTFLTNFYYV
jgi:hypothetical protein